MIIIDFHTHIYPDRIAAATVDALARTAHIHPFTDGTANGLLQSMREAGVSRSVILPVATAPKQLPRINETAARINREYAKAGRVSFAGMHPDAGDPEGELERIAAAGFSGIKVHPVYQNVDLDDPRYLRIFRKCGELGLIVVTHTGIDIGYPDTVHCSPEMAKHALEEAGPFKFVLGHMGGWREWDRALALLSGLDVWLDTSFSTGAICPLDDGYYTPEDLPLMQETAFLEMVQAFGAGRILFGTDSPWSEQKASADWILGLPLSSAEKEQILGGNAARLLYPDLKKRS